MEIGSKLNRIYTTGFWVSKMRNNVDYILMKFISKKEFLDDFLKASLYMNSLYFLGNEYPLEVAKKEKRDFSK